MQPFVSALSTCLAMLLAGISAAQEIPPNNLRVCVQLIEVPLPVLTEMMAGKQTDGSVLHPQAMDLVKSGGANDSNAVMTRSGQRTTIESNREMMYPSENFAMMGMCGLSYVPGFPMPAPDKPARNLRYIPPCYSTRFAGVTLEVEPTLQDNSQIVELRMNLEMVAPIGEISPLNYGPEWGGGPVRIPIFEAWRTNALVDLMTGKFECVSVITPKDQAPAPAVARRILVFVRADVVPVLHSP